MENEWSYRSLSVKEGLKPGSKHFQYFFIVSDTYLAAIKSSPPITEGIPIQEG